MSESMTAQKGGRPRRSLADWTSYVEGLHPKNIEMGLERIRIVKERLGIRFECPVVIVGGTNGKGSTCTMLQTIWKEAGYRTGLYTSPHIHLFNERIVVDGKMADDEALVSCFEKVETVRGDVELTFFEFTTLVALELFARARLDVVVLEVGLGGRLDAVNMLDADVAIVTNVDVDHVEYLGNTREKIGFEKAGIYRSGRAAFYGEANPPATLVSHAADIGAKLRILGRDYSATEHGDLWDFRGKKQLDDLFRPSLQGENQIRNATTVLAAIEELQQRLPVSTDAIKRGLQNTRLPGRFEILQRDPLVVLDVAHNPHAADVLAENLRNMPVSGKTHAVYGAMADKDIDGVIAKMRDLVDFWYLTDLPLPRAASAEFLKSRLVAAGIHSGEDNPCIMVYKNAKDAMSAARNNVMKNDRIVAFGSFWVVTGVTENDGLDSFINLH